ncbi:MAG: hypothetical protein K0Q95_2047 [Bacteroidota bacterium]|jgi:hypothetical protein|nr:hypothetical protein [Bacteroidota bacterium]
MKHLLTTLSILLALKTFSQTSSHPDSLSATSQDGKQYYEQQDPGFTATSISGDDIEFSWSCMQSAQVDLFEIEASTDAIHFSLLQKITSENSEQGKYSVRLKKNTGGTGYYRLKKITSDGNSFYSRIVAVVSNEANSEITIFPNPSAGNIVNFRISSGANAGNAFVRITGRSGRTIYASGINGSLEQHLALEQGYYLLILTEGNGNIITKKIVVN